MATNPKDVPQHYYSLEEYFALEDASDARFEYWDGDILCMSGGSRAHGTISSNVHYSLASGLRGGKCRAFTGDTAIWTPTLPPYRYPDASAACGELELEHIKGHDALVKPRRGCRSSLTEHGRARRRPEIRGLSSHPDSARLPARLAGRAARDSLRAA